MSQEAETWLECSRNFQELNQKSPFSWPNLLFTLRDRRHILHEVDYVEIVFHVMLSLFIVFSTVHLISECPCRITKTIKSYILIQSSTLNGIKV